MARRRALWLEPVVLSVAAVNSLLVVGAVVQSWIRDYVSEDQALLWAAADSWAHGRPRQPNFWGQAYGTTFEAIPATVFHRLGLGYQTGLPLGVAALNLTAWLLLGLAAWRRGRRGTAAAAVGALALLSPGYLVQSAAYNTAFGRLLAAAAAALVLHRSPTWRTAAMAGGVMGMALVFDNSTAILAAPVAVYALGSLLGDPARRTELRRAGTWVLLAVAVLPALAWAVWARWWHHAHPDAVIHPVPSLSPSWSRLWDNLTHPSRHFGSFEPELARWMGVPVLFVVGLAVVSVVMRQWLRVACLTATVVVVMLVLAVPRANDVLDSPYYSAPRLLLAVPMAAWFVAAIAPIVPPRAAASARWLKPAVVIASLCVLSTGVRALRWHAESLRIRDEAVDSTLYPLTPAAQLRSTCTEVRGAVKESRTRFAIFAERTRAYACAALDPEVTTVYPPYERRDWVLRELLRSPASSFVYVGEPPSCAGTTLSCRRLGPATTEIAYANTMTTLAALDALGIVVRPPFESPH